jgi:dihydroxyacetone kinase
VPVVTTSVPDNRPWREVYISTAPQSTLVLINQTKKMTDRHIFNDHTTLVLRSLKGLVATHPYLSLIPSLKVVYRADHDRSKVSLICGGGSGHEPGTVGFVGKGLLNASVAGDVFASPSARQVGGAIERVGSDKGVILIITNCECKQSNVARPA